MSFHDHCGDAWDVELDFLAELDSIERTTIDATHWHALDQYVTYRKRGMEKSAAFLAAYAWGQNMTEQRERRLAHETGAT